MNLKEFIKEHFGWKYVVAIVILILLIMGGTYYQSWQETNIDFKDSNELRKDDKLPDMFE